MEDNFWNLPVNKGRLAHNIFNTINLTKVGQLDGCQGGRMFFLFKFRV